MLQTLLVALGFTAFLTGTKLLPVRHNVGLFEVVAGLVLLFVASYGLAYGWRPRFHAVSLLAVVLVVAAALSLLKAPSPLLVQAIENLAVLTFLVLVLVVIHNTGLMFLHEFPRFVRALSWAGVTVGAWVVLTSGQAGWSIEVYGPFRNRAHMGIYLLTVFWIIVLALAWPGEKPLQRTGLALSLPLVLYGIAASGRRSVYLSLFIGLTALLLILWATGRRRRIVVAAAFVVSALFLATLFAVGEQVPKQTGFFRLRVTEVLPRLRTIFGSEPAASDTAAMFFYQQRTGAIQAFLDNPVMGIGYGAFARSGYPGSKFEIHSTPLRFLAETGVVGITAYAMFIGVLLMRTLRAARRAWDTPFRGYALVFAVAWWSLVVSYAYNRHVNERTFWLLLAMFLVFEAYLERWLLARRAAAAAARSETGPMPTRAVRQEARGRR